MVNSLKDVKIAVIGGSGLYKLEGLEVIEEINPETVKYKSFDSYK
jgi:5'-methylthioadenosine phosphorylase